MKMRIAKESDMPFIYSTWQRGQFHGYSEYEQKVNKQIFFRHYTNIIKDISKSPNTYIYVVTLDDDDDVIIGYIVMSKNVLHWAYVKQAWRNRGIFKLMYGLFVEQIKYYSGFVENTNALFIKLGLTYNPFLLYSELKES